MRPARLCLEMAAPTWLGRAPLHAAAIFLLRLAACQGKDLIAEARRAAPVAGWLRGRPPDRAVADRDALIDQLWSAIEALPDPDQPSDTKRPSKQDAVVAMLQRPEGATVDEVASVMGWQRHTVRGLFSGTLKKKLGLTLASATEERGRVYRIAAPEQA